MTDLLEQIAQYIANNLTLVLGQSVFYYEMPETPDTCICVYERKNLLGAPVQIDAQDHKIEIGIRARTNVEAKQLAMHCYYQLLDIADADRADSAMGFIQLPTNTWIYVYIPSEPIWDKVDAKGRKYFMLSAIITKSR